MNLNILQGKISSVRFEQHLLKNCSWFEENVHCMKLQWARYFDAVISLSTHLAKAGLKL